MPQTQGNVRERTAVREPDMYDVVLYNDDFTTMDFVVMILIEVFFLSGQDANNIMLSVHNNGSAVAGTYTFDIATSKVLKVKRMAHAEGFPLRLAVRKH